jgi:hypothetical protein
MHFIDVAILFLDNFVDRLLVLLHFLRRIQELLSVVVVDPSAINLLFWIRVGGVLTASNIVKSVASNLLILLLIDALIIS